MLHFWLAFTSQSQWGSLGLQRREATSSHDAYTPSTNPHWLLLPLEMYEYIGSSIIASCYRILSGQLQLNARCLGILGVQPNRSTAGSIALSNRDYFPPRTHLRHRFLKCNIKHRLRLFLEFGHSYPRSANNEETIVISE